MNRNSPVSLTVLLAAAAVTLPNPAHAADWKPVPGHILTRWAKDVDPARPLPEYPRPQLVRPAWVNLNGLWEYAITPAAAAARPDKFDGQILVPFPVESSLSGVRKTLKPEDRLWYRRTFAAPAEFTAGRRLLLHFGAVDWDTRVWLNGKEVGAHQGGYDGFSCDLTDAVKTGGDNELIVSVQDATGGLQPRGKQKVSAIDNPGGIFYTPCSGIWETVWLESVPADYVGGLRIAPDIDKGEVVIQVSAGSTPGQASAAGTGGRKVDVSVLDGGRVVAQASGAPGADIVLKVPQAKLWTPETPFLYDLKVRYGDDEAGSYFGMRRVSLGKDEQGHTRILLNNKPTFLSGPLDQGFWPDGIYTAPTDAALRSDIEITKKLGFNGTRKHVKVEPDRWYYWCDKLGLLVWQDMPSGDEAKGATKTAEGTVISPEANEEFIKEMSAMIEGRRNHPSIVMWTVFNEGWGQHDTVKLTSLAKTLDPSRLVDDASGWIDYPAGDVHDMHKYPAPGSPTPEPNRAAVLGEFGGLGLPVPEHMWTEKSWGYKGMEGQEALTVKYVDLWKDVEKFEKEPGLSAAIYTQLTDVETEANGLLTYDREIVKVDAAKAAAAVQACSAAPVVTSPAPAPVAAAAAASAP